DDNVEKIKLFSAIGALSEVFVSTGDSNKLIQFMNENERLLREVYDAEPENLEQLHRLAQFLGGMAENYKALEYNAEYRKYLQESAALTEEEIRRYESTELTATQMQDYAYSASSKAQNLNELGQIDEALALHERSAEIAKRAFEMAPSLELAFNLTVRARRYQADIYRQRNEFAKALEMYRISLDRIESEIENAHFETQKLKQAKDIYRIRISLMLEKTGDRKQAAELMKRAYSDYLNRVVAEKDDSTKVLFFFEALPDVAQYYLISNQIEKAVEVWEDHISRLKYFLDKNPDDLAYVIYSAEAQKRIGDIYCGYNQETKTFGLADKARITKGKNAYAKGIAGYEKAQELRAPTQAEKNVLTEIRERLRSL
ncbi:MAG: hypothetical protein ACRD6X_09685, partial [Pyrinomonadaceae bacterium]